LKAMLDDAASTDQHVTAKPSLARPHPFPVKPSHGPAGIIACERLGRTGPVRAGATPGKMPTARSRTYETQHRKRGGPAYKTLHEKNRETSKSITK